MCHVCRRLVLAMEVSCSIHGDYLFSAFGHDETSNDDDREARQLWPRAGSEKEELLRERRWVVDPNPRVWCIVFFVIRCYNILQQLQLI